MSCGSCTRILSNRRPRENSSCPHETVPAIEQAPIDPDSIRHRNTVLVSRRAAFLLRRNPLQNPREMDAACRSAPYRVAAEAIHAPVSRSSPRPARRSPPKCWLALPFRRTPRPCAGIPPSPGASALRVHAQQSPASQPDAGSKSAKPLRHFHPAMQSRTAFQDRNVPARQFVAVLQSGAGCAQSRWLHRPAPDEMARNENSALRSHRQSSTPRRAACTPPQRAPPPGGPPRVSPRGPRPPAGCDTKPLPEIAAHRADSGQYRPLPAHPHLSASPPRLLPRAPALR